MDGFVKVLLRIIKYKGFWYLNNTKPQNLGEKIVILGNGPSAMLYKSYKKRFKEYDILVVNFYPVKEKDFWVNKPKYLCLLDPVFFAPKGVYYEQKHRDVKEDIENLYEVLEEVDWKIKIVTIGDNTLPIENSNIEYIRLVKSCCGFNVSKFEAKVFYHNWAIPRAQNVLNCALYFAEIFGYKEIALFGVEQNWLQTLMVDENNNLYSEYEHFYGKQRHFHTATYESEMRAVLRGFEGFSAAEKLAKYKHINIINYSVNSYLHYFKKFRLD